MVDGMDSTRTGAIEERLDRIDRRLELLVEQMEVTRRHRREMKELRDDLGRIAGDLFQTASNELEEVAPHFETDDLVHLLKKLLRNTRNLSHMLDRLESLSDLLDDAAPLQKQAFLNLLASLDELDRRGYFTFLAELREVADRVVTSFSPEDVRLLGDNIVAILSTVRSFTQPEILSALNAALRVYRHLDDEVEGKVGFRRLLREARSPEARRGMMLGLTLLRNLANPAASSAGDDPAGDAHHSTAS